MRSLLFESPITLLIVLIVVQFCIVAIWSRIRSRRSAQIMWFGFLAIPLLMTVSWVVDTPRERIIRICHEMAEAVENGRAAEVGGFLDESIQVGQWDKDALIEQLTSLLSKYRIHAPSLSGFDFTERADQLTIEFAVTCGVSSIEGDFGSLPTRWRLTFRGRNESYAACAVETVPVPPLFARNLEELTGR